MDSQGLEFYRDSLQAELAAVSSDRGSRARLKWLAEHLEIYVDRWLAFCAAASEADTSLVSFPGFFVVELGSEAFGREFASANIRGDVDPTWQTFLLALRRVKAGGGRADAEKLEEAAVQLRAVVSRETE
jgi:hypothetical protein